MFKMFNFLSPDDLSNDRFTEWIVKHERQESIRSGMFLIDFIFYAECLCIVILNIFDNLKHATW